MTMFAFPTPVEMLDLRAYRINGQLFSIWCTSSDERAGQTEIVADGNQVCANCGARIDHH